MANLSISTPSTPGSESWGDTFSGSVLNSIAPLIALFGEQVSNQFLSDATGWLDSILFSVAPLGILTAIVSSIRLGGSKRMKALIGRARENRASAERELLNATSDSVCEMWTVDGIVRVSGQPLTKDFICRTWLRGRGQYDFKDLGLVKDAWAAYYLTLLRSHKLEGYEGYHSRTGFLKAFKLLNEAPNLTINGQRYNSKPSYLAFFAMLLQAVILFLVYFITFYLKNIKTVRPFSAIIATSLFTLVMEKCSDKVDFYLPGYPSSGGSSDSSQPMWRFVTIQKGCRMGDESFGSFAILHEEHQQTIRTSRLKVEEEILHVGIAAASTVLGFVCQFMAILGLHWSITVILLQATAGMSFIRVWTSQTLAQGLSVRELKEDHELADLNLEYIMQIEGLELRCGRIVENNIGDSIVPQERIAKVVELEPTDQGSIDNQVKIAIDTQVDLQDSVTIFSVPETDPWQSKHLLPMEDGHSLNVPWPVFYSTLATQLSSAIEEAFEYFRGEFTTGLENKFSWADEVFVKTTMRNYYHTKTYLELKLDEKEQWRLYDRERHGNKRLLALLSLIIYSIEKGKFASDEHDWHQSRTKHFKVLGALSVETAVSEYIDAYFKPWMNTDSFRSLNFVGGKVGIDLRERLGHDSDIAQYPVFGANLPYWILKSSLMEENSETPAFVVGMSFSTPLPKLVAQEIFSNFLYQVTSNCLQARSDVHNGLTSEFTNISLSHKMRADTVLARGKLDHAFKSLAKILLKFELATDMEEAMAVVLPPFWAA